MKLFMAIAGIFIFSLTYGQEASLEDETGSGARVTFLEEAHDFGDIVQGDKVEYVFAFENTGNEPLILSNVLTTCGCTATNWPRDPILPGRSGEIAVSFNSAGKMGKQNKVITVVSNAINAHSRVRIVSNVLPKKE